MRIWTISAEAGVGGERIAADLAAAAGVSLLDFKALSNLPRIGWETFPTWHIWRNESAAA